jgi:hypothetical protein
VFAHLISPSIDQSRRLERVLSTEPSAGTIASVTMLPGDSIRTTTRAAIAPVNSASMNAGTSIGRIPKKLFESELAMDMPGLANEVDAVNQYTAPIQAAKLDDNS